MRQLQICKKFVRKFNKSSVQISSILTIKSQIKFFKLKLNLSECNKIISLPTCILKLISLYKLLPCYMVLELFTMYILILTLE